MFNSKIDKEKLVQELGGVPSESGGKAALRQLVGGDWDYYFRLSCERGPAYILAQSWQWKEELEERGVEGYSRFELECDLLELAAEEHLDRDEIHKALYDRTAEWVGLTHNTEQQRDADIGLCQVWDGDPTIKEFRLALKEWAKLSKGAE